MKCRLCNSENLVQALSLGSQFVTDFPMIGETSHATQSKLEILFCNDCKLAQLSEQVDSDLMYRNYYYRSGISQTMRNALADVVKDMLSFNSEPAVVCDIASNDGYLLSCYPYNGIKAGFDPARNLNPQVPGNFTFINNYFSAEDWRNEFGNITKANCVSCVAMFYDSPFPERFCKDVSQILADDGVFICQLNTIGPVFKNKAFDFISAEHLTYWSLTTFMRCLKNTDLEVFDYKEFDLNGGTSRFYIQHRGGPYDILPSVQRQLDYEAKAGINTVDAWKKLWGDIKTTGYLLNEFIGQQVLLNKKKVFVYGASTRGLTILQTYHLDNKLIEFAADRDPAKTGHKMVGVNIPILSEEEGVRNMKPDYLLVLPYSYLPEIQNRLRTEFDYKGKFIIPLPEMKVI